MTNFKILFLISSLGFLCEINCNDLVKKFKKHEKIDVTLSFKQNSLIDEFGINSKLNCLAQCKENCVTVVLNEINGKLKCFLFNETYDILSNGIVSPLSSLFIKTCNYRFKVDIFIYPFFK